MYRFLFARPWLPSGVLSLSSLFLLFPWDRDSGTLLKLLPTLKYGPLASGWGFGIWFIVSVPSCLARRDSEEIFALVSSEISVSWLNVFFELLAIVK